MEFKGERLVTAKMASPTRDRVQRYSFHLFRSKYVFSYLWDA